MKYKKNKLIKNTCHQCNYSEMKIYRLKRYDSEDGAKLFIWCECPECGAVDDLILDE